MSTDSVADKGPAKASRSQYGCIPDLIPMPIPETMSKPLELACELVARDSQTPTDAGCQDILVERLAPLGFKPEWMNSGPVHNLWLRRGTEEPLFVFAGHTDVVPPGPLEDWKSPPFKPSVREGVLYGRGAADMKGSIAAFVCACEAFVEQYPESTGSIALLITSDEEGPSVEGTVHVVKTLSERGETIQWCLVGEPSSREQLGDVARIGRRGSLSGSLEIKGIQGHIAYPDQCRNPVHVFAPICAALCAEHWDDGNTYFPATSFQISNINAGTGVENIIPGRLQVEFNFRYCTESTRESLAARVEAILEHHGADYTLVWKHSGAPFLTEPGTLVDAMSWAILDTTGVKANLNTGGGTSDGRFIAPTGAQVVELGPVNASIHKVNECVKVEELEQLTQIYQQILVRLSGQGR